VIPTFERYPEFKNEKLMRQACSQASAVPGLCLEESRRVLALSKEAEEAVDIVNRGIVLVDDKF
jgi:hypothetical protein